MWGGAGLDAGTGWGVMACCVKGVPWQGDVGKVGVGRGSWYNPGQTAETEVGACLGGSGMLCESSGAELVWA